MYWAAGMKDTLVSSDLFALNKEGNIFVIIASE